MIRIAHIVTGLQVGGLERVVVNLVAGFRGTAFVPEVICLEEAGPFADELRTAGVTVTVLGKRRGMDWGCILHLARLFRERRIQIVHTHNPVPHFHGVIAALLARVPVRVHTKHGRNYPDNPSRVRLYRWLSWFTDMIVPVSDNARDVALLVEHVQPQKVRRIWNGVDTRRYAPGQRSEVRDQKSAVGNPTIGTVARLSPEKDQATMLRAFKLVIEQWVGTDRQTVRPEPTTDGAPHGRALPRLVFAGDGPIRNELQQQAHDLGIANHVDFLGNRSDIPELLHTLDVFTLSSTTEGISMTILEAMACEIPVVATDVGGNREIVHPPECGLIVPPRDPRALADAWLELLRDPARRKQMGQAGRQRVIAHFSLEKMVADYAALYEELLTRKGIRNAA